MNDNRQRWLVTGGAGYIGSHICRSLLAQGYDVVALDDLSTGYSSRIPSAIPFVCDDLTSTRRIADLMTRSEISGVIHLAAKKSVAESVSAPLKYWKSNVDSLRRLLDAMAAAGSSRLLFSSSAAVYGAQAAVPIPETADPAPTSPYGETKLAGERLISTYAAERAISAITLRYFNVAGARFPSLVDRASSSLVPSVVQALIAGEHPIIYGDDFETIDGTCVRDLVHVEDVADAHVRAAEAVARGTTGTFNVGTGRGVTVRSVINAAAEFSGRIARPLIRPRRAGDIPTSVAAVDKIRKELGWVATRDLEDILRDEFRARSLFND